MRMLQLSPDLVEAWLETVYTQLHPRRKPPQWNLHSLRQVIKAEIPNIRSLWESFNLDRASIGRYLSDPKKQNMAYLLGFHLTNAARATVILDRSEQRSNVFTALQKKRMSIAVLDLGCGTGAFTQALLSHWRGLRKQARIAQVILVDEKKAFLESAKTLVQRQFSIEPVVLKKSFDELDSRRLMDQLPKDAVIVVGLSYVANELMRIPHQAKKLEKLLVEFSQRNQPVCLIGLESANQYPSREFMRLRDTLVEASYAVMYPCPKATTACPMLDKARDWCFSEAYWKMPRFQAQIDRALEIDHTKIACTGFLFVNQVLMQTYLSGASVDEGATEIIVGRPTLPNAKGPHDFEYLLCTGDKLLKAPNKGTNLGLRGEPLRRRMGTVT